MTVRPILVCAFLVLAVVSAAATGVAPAAAEERITSFDIRVDVEPNADLVVTETISVIAEGQEIKRGIYRDLPVVQWTALGLLDIVHYDFLEVRRDGEPEPSFLVGQGETVRLYIGDANTYIDRGPHTYRITYRISGQIRFSDETEELYWNLTGNDWSFPIDRVTADIHLPEGAEVRDLAGYTGYYGEVGTDVEIRRDTGNRILLRTTRPFQSGEGVTVSVSWQAGLLPKPGLSETVADRAADNPGALLALAAFLALAGYYGLVWWQVGRDPRKGTIIPLFEPPEEYSPAAVGHIHARGFNNGLSPARALSVGITSLAVKGLLTIEDLNRSSGTRYVLHRTDKPADGLPPGEAVLLEWLFSDPDEDTFSIGSTFDPKLEKAQKAFMDTIRAEYSDAYFKANGGKWFLGAAFAPLVSIGAAVLNAPGGEDPMVLAGALTVFYCATVALFCWSLSHLRNRFRASGERDGTKRFVIAALISIVASAPAILFGFGVGITASYPVAVLAAGMIALVFVFFDLMDAPTVRGRAVMDQIEGYIMFMTTTEWDRMKAIGEMPAPTQAMFERHLPYSIALGVDDAWSKTFARYAKAASMPIPEHSSSWYRSRDGRSLGPMDASKSLSTRMVTALASSSYRPSSSSSGSSSSGGSSGGGGGGGGGGGW